MPIQSSLCRLTRGIRKHHALYGDWWMQDAIHNSSFDSMSDFVQDEFESTNSEDNFKHIQYMSKKHTQNISSTHLKNTSKTCSKRKEQKEHIQKTYIYMAFQFLICYTSSSLPFSHYINVTFLIFSLRLLQRLDCSNQQMANCQNEDFPWSHASLAGKSPIYRRLSR